MPWQFKGFIRLDFAGILLTIRVFGVHLLGLLSISLFFRYTIIKYFIIVQGVVSLRGYRFWLYLASNGSLPDLLQVL
jgi:hypothetical protein